MSAEFCLWVTTISGNLKLSYQFGEEWLESGSVGKDLEMLVDSG